jgi:hypothetical protein
MQNFKIQKTLLLAIDEVEAKKLAKQDVFFVENFEFEIKIYDIDKYAPQQIIEYLNER